ncbi:MAG: hypothetical protein NTV04_17085 [Deltaproteobacteria bacterium]|nr:hypothetical protein [Deltaproteobacteria bacterium]
MIRKVFPDADYVSLDLPSVAAEVEGNAERFLQKCREPLIIDKGCFKKQGIDFSRSPADAGLSVPFIQGEKYEFDERRKGTN